MILTLLQIAGIAAVAFCLVRWRMSVRRRNSQTWETLLARLRPDWSARELSDHFLWKEGLSATPDDAWKRMEGPKGLWVMYQNAQILLEMSNYAATHCEGVDRLLVETLHSDAMQIRVCVLMALAQYAFTQASEGVRINAFRAASIYTGMAARMTLLLQDHAATMVPDFVAAM
ncbi:MAG TPA: hypothetical protein VHX20_10495 [Terracidiphilus sp.]|jgi:hypothetical protein|nr:hypothetical protein [Terracidiphilus sp.]